MRTAAGAHTGVLGGLPCLFGVMIDMGVMMFLVPLGLGSLVLERPRVLPPLHWRGATFRLWLSWKVASSTAHIESSRDRNPVGFLGAALLHWINPKPWLVSASAASALLSAETGSPVVQAVGLGSLFGLATLPSCLAWLASAQPPTVGSAARSG